MLRSILLTLINVLENHMSDGITDCARQCENYLELCRKYNEFPKIKIVNGVEYIDFFSDHYYNLLALDRSTTGK